MGYYTKFMAGDKKRVFIAVPISDDLGNQLFSFIEPYRNLEKVRWIPKENWHLTVLPPQYWTESEIQKIQVALSEITVSSFTVEANKIILAPPDRTPRMIWLLYKHSRQFFDLQKEIVDILKRAGISFLLNFHKEKNIHLTLARFRAGAWIDFDDLVFEYPMVVERIKLLEVFLKKTGAEYKAIAEISFKGAEKNKGYL